MRQRKSRRVLTVFYRWLLVQRQSVPPGSARINGQDLHAYSKDVLDRLPPHPANRIEELLPHRRSARS